VLHDIHGTTSTRVHDLSQRQLRKIARVAALGCSSTLRYFGGVLKIYPQTSAIHFAFVPLGSAQLPGSRCFADLQAECRELEKKELCREDAAAPPIWGVDRCSN
jgi:hypothetical protein